MISYNIGGMTAICMEDLLDLAIANVSGSWDPINRIIEIVNGLIIKLVITFVLIMILMPI